MIATKRATAGAATAASQPAPRSRFALSTLLGFAVVSAALALSGCEDKAIGRVCDLQADGGENQAVVNSQALECPSRVCLRPANEMPATVTTTALCTAECSKDSDCDGAETRNGANANDHRCKSGFVCGVASVTGSFCCKKLCMCKDFLNIPASGLETPAVCNKSVNPGACPLVK